MKPVRSSCAGVLRPLNAVVLIAGCAGLARVVSKIAAVIQKGGVPQISAEVDAMAAARALETVAPE